MTETTHLALPFLDAAQAQKHVTHNEALQLLDAVVQLSVTARGQGTPPAQPSEGARVLVGAGATGAFAGKSGQIATFIAGGWVFLAPKSGWRAYVEAEQTLLVYDGAQWVDAGRTLRELQNLGLLGLGTTADANNPLSAKLNAALFSARSGAEGGSGDLRVSLNKSAQANTVSQLYQSNWSGRAETGLTGDDHFHVKVSPDGASWIEAINVDPATGFVGIGVSTPNVQLEVANIIAARGGIRVYSPTSSAGHKYQLGPFYNFDDFHIAHTIDGFSSHAPYLTIKGSNGAVGIGTLAPSATLHVNGAARLGQYTVGTLPSASSVGAGGKAFVSDASSAPFADVVAGGGANFVPVYSDGANWRIG